MNPRCGQPLALSITDNSMVGEARRAATAIASACGLDEPDTGRIAIAVSEAATNMLRHAGGGQLLLLPHAAGGGLDMLALDKGRGMHDLSKCLADGYSTGGTPGTGLGAMSRLADLFDVYTFPDQGTALLCRFGSKAANPSPMNVGGLAVPHPGERICGDAWTCHSTPHTASILVVDGLGHGPGAAEAAHEAVRVFHENPDVEPVPMLQTLHAALKKTRGAAATVARIDPLGATVRYCGVGNIMASILFPEGSIQSLVSNNGTVGHQMPRASEFHYPFPPGSVLAVCSDGILTQWKLGRYNGITQKAPALIAGLIYRDFARGRDDATVVVARQRTPDEMQ